MIIMAKENMDKIYVFYMNSGYIWWQAKEEATSEYIWITEETTLEEDEKLLQSYYEDFIWSLDSWWYEKD